MWAQKMGLEAERDTFKHGLCQGLHSKHLSTGMAATQSLQAGRVPAQGSGGLSAARIYHLVAGLRERKKGDLRY